MALRHMALVAAFAAASISVVCGADTQIADKLKMFKLKNGMTVFVYPRKDAPVFCGMLYVDAGSAEENSGETGIAHLLEHMAFKGTPWIGTSNWQKERPVLEQIEKTGEQLTRESNQRHPDKKRIDQLTKKLADLQQQAAQFVVPNEYDQIVTRAGGTGVNASTSADYTNYYMTLPSNQLELWAMLESQRLLYPSWREFYKERDVVAEERRMRSEDSPDGRTYEAFISTAFVAHPYRNPVIGWMSDIYNLTIKKTDDFYRRWYVPENMVAVLVGDVEPDQVHQVMNKYFGSIPAEKSPQHASTKEPRQMGERRTVVDFPAQPQIMVGWHKPTFPEKDAYVFEVIQYLLTRTGRSSRLYSRLVKQDGLCTDVDSFTAPGDKYPNVMMLQLIPRAPHSNAEVERALNEEIERIKREPVTDNEMEKLRNQIDAQFIQDLESNNGFARQLGYNYLITRDPNVLDTMRKQMKSVTAQDIMRVAQKYLTKDNRNVVELITAHATSAKKPEPKTPTEIRPENSSTTATQIRQNDTPTTAPQTNNPGSKAQ